MTTKFLDNKIFKFKMLLSCLSHEKQRFGRFSPLPPRPPPLKKRKLYFYCRLAVSDRRRTHCHGCGHASCDQTLRARLSRFTKKARSCQEHHRILLEGHTKEYLNHRGTKIRVFRVRFQAPFLPPFFPHFSPRFPLKALFTLPPLLPSSPPPLSPPFRVPENSDLGTPLI